MAIDWEAYRKKAKKRDEYEYQKNIANNDIAPIRTTTTLTGDDIAPTPVTTTAQEDKYSKLTLAEIEAEISRLQTEKTAYEEKFGNKATLMASSVADKILSGFTNAMGIETDVDASASKTGIDKLNDYQAEIEKLQTYQLQKAIEEKYNVLDEETLSEVETLSGLIGEGHIKGILDMVGIQAGGETEEEKAARKSLKKKGYSDDDIVELVELHNRQKQSNINREYEKEMADFGSEHPVAQIGQSAFTDIYGSLGGTLSDAQQYINKLQGKGSKYGTNTDDIYHGITKGNIVADTQAKADHNWKIETPTGQELDAFDIVFDVGSGVADNMARMVVGGGNSSASGAMMGSQVFNQSVIEGKEKGYSDEKALTIGLLQASIESLTEKYSVETILGDSGGIARKLAKSFIAEGSEGVTSDWLNRTLDVIANGNHSETMKTYNSYIEDGYSEKDALVQMIYEIGGESLKTFLLEGTTGFVLGGGVTLVNTAQQKTSTQSEKTTVNKLVEERVTKAAKEQAIEKAVNKAIEERETAQGGKFTDENKKALRETIMAQIESGEIDISSEKLSKKDIAKIEKEVKDSLKNGKIDLSKIEEILTPDATKEINELKETLKNTKDEQKKAEIEGKIKQLESIRAENLKNQARENKYLAKAVYEKVMGLERYADDSEVTDEYEKAVVESAKKNANNTTETRKYVDVVRKLAKDRQTRYVFTNNQELLEQGDLVARDDITPEEQAKIKSLESQLSKATTKEAKASIQAQLLALKYYDTGGLVRKNDNGVETVLINVDSIQSKYSVVGHETKHTLEKYGLNEDFNKILFEYAEKKGDLDTVRNRITDIYKNQENVDIDGEVAAELTGKYLFEDEKFLETLMKNKSDSKVKQAIEKIKELIDDLVIRFKGTEQEKQLREVQKKFTELYNSTEADIVENEAQKNTTDKGDVKYSVTKSFSEQVDDVISGSHNPRFDLYVSETPQYLIDLNFKEGPLLMRNSKIQEILDAHPEMDEGIIKALPEAMAKPTLVLKSKTHPTESVVVITDVMTQKGEAIVPVWVNQEGSYIDVDFGETNTETNFVASYYGRNIKHLIEYADANDGFLYQSDDIEKVRQLLARNGLQLPTPLKLSNSIITLPQNPKSVNTQLSSFEDYVETNSKAVMTNERIDYLIEDSGAGSRQDYANYWITSISPTDFINLTTTEKTQDRDFFDSWGSEWNPESNMSTYDYMGELKKNMRQTPYLAIDINTGEVVGHEGRHRMRALEQNGITSAEIRVEFRDEDGRIIKYSPDGKRLQIKDAMQIINQFGTKQTATIENIIPLNKDYRNEILENYGEKTAQQNDVRYSLSDIETKYKDKTDYLFLHERNDSIAISNMVVKEAYRNQGIGTQILNDIIAYADEKGKTITLTPTTEFGTQNKLKKWYKANGFVENKGRNADFRLSDTMYRLPKKNTKYSLSDSNGRELSTEQQDFFRLAKTRDEEGRLKPFYHGTGRADRVGNVFDPERATSGPMAYFTDNKEIADNYARDKKDTSIAYDSDYDSYETQFRVNRNGKDMSIVDLWNTLSMSERNAIKEKAKHITMDDDWENVIYSEDAQYGLGNFDAYELNAHRGNALHTLIDSWLTDGNIYGEEYKFLDVLKLVGIEDAKYMNPDFRDEKTYQVYLNITNPFDTSNISIEMLDALRKAAENTEFVEGNSADFWDKRSISPEQWIERLEDDIENGTTHAWTSIPDFVTDTLKAHGYDGIFDTGGKGGGESHTVAIPFYSEQIKNVDNLKPTTSNDIRYSLSKQGENVDYNKSLRSMRYGDIAPIRDDIWEKSNTDLGDLPIRSDIAENTKEYISFEDFANKESLVWNNVDYNDDATKTKIMQETHKNMVDEGSIVVISDDVRNKVAQAYPDLRSIKKSERKPILKEAMRKAKKELRNFLNGLKEQDFEFEVNGKVLEARIYNAGINEVLEKVTKEKSEMVYSTEDIFRNARYLYSTNDYDDDSNVYRWNYFYTPIKIDENIVGVRIAVRDIINPRQSQIYHWGIKKDTSLDGVSDDSLNRSSHDVSSDVSNEIITHNKEIVNNDIAPMQEPVADDDIAPPVKSSKKKGDIEQPIAKILTKEPESKKKSPLWSKIKTNFIDKASPFETLALKTGNREVDAKFNSIRYSDTKAQLLIGDGVDGVKALNDIRAEVEKNGLTEALYDYLYHKHNVDRMSFESREAPNFERLTEEIRKLKLDKLNDNQLLAISKESITKETSKKRANLIETVREYLKSKGVKNKPVFGSSMTAEMSQKIVDEYEANNPKLIEYANDVYTYNKYLRNLLVEGGVISQETADLWEEMYPHYVPVRRIDSSGLNINVPLDSGRTGINAPIKRAKGGNTDILPLFDTMAQRTLQTYKAVAKNRFGIELKNTLGTTVASGETSLDEIIDSIDTQDDLLKEGKYGKNPTFTVFENGEKVTFEITDEMYDAMKPTSEGLAYTNKVANTISNSMRGVLTEYNPTFMLTNAIKDAQDVLINSQHPVKTYKNFPKAVKELASKGKWYTEYMKNGGADNTYFDKQTNTFNEEKGKLSKVIGFPLEKISVANNFIERIPRLAEYIASREQGRTVDVSMLDAARVTTNFSAGGDVTKFLNRNGATFLNASVQGAAQQVRNVREAKANGLKGWVQLVTKVALAGLPAILLNGLLWDDDEEYEELSDYVKQNYYVVAKTQDGKFVRIPKGRALAVIQDAFTQVQNALTGDDEVDLQSFLDLAISNLAPNNPLDNNIIAPIMQVKENKTWYGEDLVPTRLQDVPDAEQYDESTDAISKWLGEKLNYSPYKINYLLNQYSGGLGDVFLPMLTPEAESGDGSFFTAPMKDKFTTDSVFNNQYTTDFYNVSDELTVNANSINATDEDVLKNKYFNSVSTEIGELYKEKREIQNSNLSDDLKFKQVRDIQKQINEITENALNTYENVTINGSYANIGDRHYRLNDDGEWQKITDEQLEKQNEVIDILGITPSQYWGNKQEYDMKAFYPEKYEVLQKEGISVADYKENYEESAFIYTDDFSWAADNPGKYAISKAVTDDVMEYKQYTSDLDKLEADKDSNGKSISGSLKKKKVAYINGLDIDIGAKYVLYKSQYPSDDTYNKVIFEYINGRSDITRDEKITILEELGAKVDSNGYIYW